MKPHLFRRNGKWIVERWGDDGGGPHPGGWASYSFRTHKEAYQFALDSYALTFPKPIQTIQLLPQLKSKRSWWQFFK